MRERKRRWVTTQRHWIVACSILASANATYAEINLELRPAIIGAPAGGNIGIGLFAVSDDLANQSFSAIQTIISWDETTLELTGIDQTGAVTLQSSSFSNDPCGLNESNPPADGDGIHVAMAQLGNPVDATPDGVLITTFLFTVSADACSGESAVDILPAAGKPQCETKVFDGKQANTVVTGTLSGSTVSFRPCPADLNHTGEVNVDDLLKLIGDWGTCDSEPPCCRSDINRSALVNVDDLLLLIEAWGPC